MKALVKDPLDLVVIGVGGQGNVLASQVLGRALMNAGYQVTVGETYGLSQRGGTVMSQVRVSGGPVLGPLMPEFGATAIVSLEPVEALRAMSNYGNPEVVVVTNDRPLYPLGVIAGEQKYPDLDELKSRMADLSGRLYWLPATQVALELGNAILANVVLLGSLAATGLLPVEMQALEDALAELFPPDKMDKNRAALAKGHELLQDAA